MDGVPIGALVSLVGVAIIVIAILANAIKVIPEYQRAVKFRLGRALGVVGPGLVVIIPLIDRLVVYDLRIVVVDLPAQKALTKDNVEVTVDAAVYLRVIDAFKVALTVSNHVQAVAIYAASVLRDVIGMVDLDTLLTQREEIARRITEIVDQHVTPWGLKITAVTIKDIKLPEALIRAMASQAEAERIRRAKITLAQAEVEASKLYLEAAQRYSANPTALALRQLDALVEIAREKNLVVVVPNTLQAISMPVIAQHESGK